MYAYVTTKTISMNTALMYIIGAKCAGTSGTVADLELLSRVLHVTYFLADLFRKFYSTGLTNN